MIRKLVKLLVFFTSYSAFADELSSRSPALFGDLHAEDQTNLNIPEEPVAVKSHTKIGHSITSRNDGYPAPHCQNSDTLQSLMKILLYLVKQEKKRTDTPKFDKIRESITLYKQYLLSSMLTRERLALLNELIKIEKTLQNYPKNENADKITVKFDLPVPSQPRCLKELNHILLKVHDAYARLKSSGICGRNEDFDEKTSAVHDFTNGSPTLQYGDGIDYPPATPSGDPDKFDPESMNYDIYSFLNDKKPKKYSPSSQNKLFIKNYLFSQQVEDPKQIKLKQTLPDQKNLHMDDKEKYRDLFLSLLNSKQKESPKKPSDARNDLLSLLLNKLKDNENNKPSQNQGSFASNTILMSILQDILDSGKGHLGPSDDFINKEHLSNFGEAEATQDGLFHNPDVDSTVKPKPKLSYPNPFQDLPLGLEAIGTQNIVYPNIQNEPSLLKSNIQLHDLQGLEFESKYTQQQPHDTNQLNRISDKLRFATFLANNLNKSKKEQKKPVLNHNGVLSSNNFLRLSHDQVPSNVYEEDEMNPINNKEKNATLSTEFLPYKFSRFDEKKEEELLEKYPQMYNDVPGGETIYKLITSPNQTGVLELTYLLNRPELMAEPFYLIKYKIPFETFVLNFKKLLSEQPLRPKTAEMFYKDLLVKSSSDIVDSTSTRRSALKGNITDEVLRNGTLLDAKVVNDNSTSGFVEVTVKTLPGKEQLKSHNNVLNLQKIAAGENSYPNSQPLGAHKRIEYPDSWKNNEKDNDVDLLESDSTFPSVDELSNKLKDIWSPGLLKISRSDESVEGNSTLMLLSENEGDGNIKK